MNKTDNDTLPTFWGQHGWTTSVGKEAGAEAGTGRGWTVERDRCWGSGAGRDAGLKAGAGMDARATGKEGRTWEKGKGFESLHRSLIHSLICGQWRVKRDY